MQCCSLGLRDHVYVRAKRRDFDFECTKNIPLEEEEFGLRTLLDVLDNEVKVTNSELNLISSKANEFLQKYELKKVIGTLTIKDMIDNYEMEKVESNNFVLPSVFDIDFK